MGVVWINKGYSDRDTKRNVEIVWLHEDEWNQINESGTGRMEYVQYVYIVNGEMGKQVVCF